MQIYLILALIIAIVAVIFAVQNVAVVAVSFFAWHIQIPLAVALLAALGVGVLITILLSLPGKVKGRWNSASNRKKFVNLEAERDGLKAKIDQMASDRDRYIQKSEDSEKEIADLEERLASFSAALEEAEDRLAAMAPAAAIPPQVEPPAGADQPAGTENQP
jgi:uncharacterized integral membrane protein